MRKTGKLKSLFQAIKKNFILIIAVTVIVMLLGVLYAKMLVTPLYTSSVEVMVSESSGAETADCIVFMQNDVVLQKVTENLEGKYTLSRIKSMLTFEQVNDSSFIRITADTPSPEDSRQLCLAVAENAEKVIEETLYADALTIIGTANTPENASSPDVFMYGLAGAVIGLVICLIVVYVKAIRDNTIKDKHSVTENFDLPFFGEIPPFDTDSDYRNQG